MGFEGGPWGIVIVISAFMTQVLTFGVTGAIGVYNIEFLDYFQASASEVSFVTALNYGAFFSFGPVVSYLMTKFSYRKIVLGGSVLVVIGVLAVPLFPNLYIMYLTLGIIYGIGSSCAYIPSHTMCGLYYDKYRSLATGIATGGSGFGYAIIPTLVGVFIELYTWQGSFIIIGGFCLHLFIFGALLRSPPKVQVEVKVDEEKRSMILQNEKDSKDCLENVDRTPNELKEIYSKFTPDIFGSMVAMDDDDQFMMNRKDGGVHFEDTKLQSDQTEVLHKGQKQLPESARHIYIFKNYNFVIYFINNYFWNASISLLSTFVPEYFRLQGHSILHVSWIMGSFGLGAFFGGIFGGALGNIKGMNRICLFILSCFLLGLITLLILVQQSFAYFACIMALLGLSFGIVLGLLMVVLSDLIGIESLGNGMGYLMLSSGLGTFTGPVFAGVLIDSTGSYASSLYLSACMSFLSAASMCLIPLRRYMKCC